MFGRCCQMKHITRAKICLSMADLLPWVKKILSFVFQGQQRLQRLHHVGQHLGPAYENGGTSGFSGCRSIPRESELAPEVLGVPASFLYLQSVTGSQGFLLF